MEMGQKNLEHGTPGARGAVLDGLPSQYGPLYLSENLRPGTTAQLGSLYDPGVPPQHQGKLPVPQAAHEAPIKSPRDTNQGRTDFYRALQNGSKANNMRGDMKCMDLGGNMKDC